MRDRNESSSIETDKIPWELATGKWMVDQLHLVPPEPVAASSGLAPEDVRRLQEIAKAGTTHFYFPKRLEERFTQEQRQQNRIERLSVAILTMSLFALAPLWAHWMLSLPDGTRTLELWLCLGIAVPAFAIAAVLQYYFVASELAEGSFLLALCAEVIVIETLRLHAAKLGVYIVPTMTSAVPIATFALIGLSFRRRVTLFFGYFSIIWVADYYFGDVSSQ